jgi:thiol-disulfide isomerase/thioredoxin
MKFLSFAAFFAATALVSAEPAAAPFVPVTLAIGSAAPDFDLPGIDGARHKLADFASAKILAVVFTCNHCPEAYAAAPRLQETADAYKDQGVAVVAISGNDPLALRSDELSYAPHGDSFAEMKLAAKEAKWTIPYLYDGETQAVSKAYGAVSTPHLFIFDAQRKLRYTGRVDEGFRKHGPVEKSQMREVLDALLAGKEPPVTTTRPYGCSTKWSYKRASVQADNEAWDKRAITVDSLDGAKAQTLAANATENFRLINFWSTTCAPCIAEMPELVETARRFQNRNFEFITISNDPSAASKRVLAVLKKKKVATPHTRMDELKAQGRTTTNYQVTDGAMDAVVDAIDKEWNGALPHTVLIAPGGKVLWRHQGEIDIVECRRQIVKALADSN